MEGFSELFTVSADSIEIINGIDTMVKVKVVFANEPKDKAEYDQVASNALKLKLTFNVETIVE